MKQSIENPVVLEQQAAPILKNLHLQPSSNDLAEKQPSNAPIEVISIQDTNPNPPSFDITNLELKKVSSVPVDYEPQFPNTSNLTFEIGGQLVDEHMDAQDSTSELPRKVTTIKEIMEDVPMADESEKQTDTMNNN